MYVRTYLPWKSCKIIKTYGAHIRRVVGFRTVTLVTKTEVSCFYRIFFLYITSVITHVMKLIHQFIHEFLWVYKYKIYTAEVPKWTVFQFGILAIK